MKATKVILVIAGLILMCSCESGYKGFEKTDTGLYYQFHVQNATNHIPVNDEIISMIMSIKTENDSLIQPAMQITTAMQAPKFKGDIFEALSLMHEGDSATFIINARQYYNSYSYGQIPSFVKDEKTMLWFTIKINSVVTYEQFQQVALLAKQGQEIQAIEQYLQEKNLTVSPLDNGLYYIETKKGSGESPKEGQTCVMNYTGMFLDGTVFDSSVGRDPFEFQLGRGMVIQGWDIGVSLMQKGGKAVLVLPSHIAYGERGAGSIPPNTPLVFEVELLGIK